MLRFTISLICFLAMYQASMGQVVPIDNYSVNASGQVQLSIQGNASKYYLLTCEHSPTFEWVSSMTMGVNGTMVISEPGAAYPIENYTITAYDIANPGDWDGDGIDDVTEFNNMPTDAPINNAFAIDFVDGATCIPDAETFMALATVQNVGWAPFLDGQLYVKFGILDRNTPEPKVYFINSNTYIIHGTFFNAIGADVTGDDGSGEIVFNPNQISPEGVIGTYSFNFSFGDALSFEATQRTYELLCANMPFLQNNLNHFIAQGDEANYLNNYADDYVGSRIDVVLESEVFGDVPYIPFHEAEGYGYFRHMEAGDTPGSRDIVLYDQLPNSLPRVGGIITSVIQTPLSHVNLRAIQDDVPNAFIGNPLLIDSIANLLGSYVHYVVENDHFLFHAATLDEVNAWYEDRRPAEAQFPIRDLSITEIKPLSDITFDMSTAFGAKVSNVATMRTFGFPEGTIPDGFGIPFYFYHEFMLYNNFYEEAEIMINNPAFINDINFRTDRLSIFRETIRDAEMPQWMMDALQVMHDAFPEGTKVRCRSSTNNEDLPGFSGAGLYTSKTHELDEGHISKTIKQVFASMWTFRAFEERDFSRVDHFTAAMGILCHPNYDGEQANGVGISIDPIYETEGTYYINTQIGESLITNPDPNARPEEILLYEDPEQGAGYLVLNLSNLTEPGQLVMDVSYLDQLREYLTVIHNEFAILYDVEGAEGFGMDIEYKVDTFGVFVIKQARPWVSFWANVKGDYDLGVESIVEPQSGSNLGSAELVSARISNNGLNDMTNFDLTLFVDDVLIQTMNINQTIAPFSGSDFEFTTPVNFAAIGNYEVKCIVTHPDDEFAPNDTLITTISKMYQLDGGVTMGTINSLCGDAVGVDFVVHNYGENEITNVIYEVEVNGQVVGTFNEAVSIPSGEQGNMFAEILGSGIENGDLVTVQILSFNNQTDSQILNNVSSTTATIESNYDIVTLVINADDFPQETSWELFDLGQQVVLASGDLDNNTIVLTEDFCVDYTSCFTITLYDSFGDGICCGYGLGNFLIENADGDVIVTNDGEFDDVTEETFCPGDASCSLAANINVQNAMTANDGSISINVTSGIGPYEYSINGGANFFASNTFTGLTPGGYLVVVQGGIDNCTYEQVVYIETCTFVSADIEVTHASSNVVANGSIMITPTSGVAPYMYSNDGGITFVPENTFLNLPLGNYNVVVQDASGICDFEAVVPVEVIVSTDDLIDAIGLNAIRMYPNPTADQVTIELISNTTITEKVYVVVTDNLGRVIHRKTISYQDSGQTTISLDGYAAGNYFVKCYSDTFDKTFKLIKM
jgi:hypothetical protein